MRGEDLDEMIREHIEGPRGPVDMPVFFCGQGLICCECVEGPTARCVKIVSEKINGDLICSMDLTREECVRLLLGCGVPILNRNEG